MNLGVKDLSELLDVSEKTIRRWITQKKIPAYRINGQYRFNRTEILEWATANRITVSAKIFDEPEQTTQAGFTEALKAGGIFYRVSGCDKESALRSVVEHIRLPEDADREYLLQFLLAREEMASTGIGDGIAIPHVRNPIVLHVTQPLVTLCFLEKAIDFLSLDGQPVNCLFTLITPTVRSHLYLLSRLSFALKNPAFKNAVTRQSSREEILKLSEEVEKAVEEGRK